MRINLNILNMTANISFPEPIQLVVIRNVLWTRLCEQCCSYSFKPRRSYWGQGWVGSTELTGQRSL